MKGKNLKKVASAVLALAMVVQSALPVYAEEPVVSAEPSWKTGLKDHWSFEESSTNGSNQTIVTSDAGSQSVGVLNGITIEDTGSAVFGNALKFGGGPNKYMRLADYINTGTGQTSFSMWYKYDTTVTGDDAVESAVLLQHEDKGNKTGRTVLSLKSDGKYNTYINGTNADTTKAVQKGGWEHITVVFDQENKTAIYYVNGEADGAAQNIGTTATNEVLSLRLGAHKTDGNMKPHPMRGYVDEFYVYEKALTAEEAKSVYEDKAAELFKEELKPLITEAETLLAESTLPEDDELRTALQQAIDAANEALNAENPTMEALKAAKEALKTAISNYKANQPIGLTVNTENVTQKIDADSIFGINHRYAFNGYGTFDSQTMKMKEDFTKLYEAAGFGSIRYPGGTISNLFNWKTTLGSKDQRKDQIHGFYNNPKQGGIAPNFGLGEIATFADSVDSEIVYVYSLGRGSVQDAEDLIEYLNAKVGTNPNGGVDWAKVRAENGHPEPYNVRYFEIGNEMNQGGDDGTTSQQYWTAYVNGGAENAYIDGGTASFDKKYAVKEEDWNKVASQSDGSKNQVRYLRYANVNPGTLNEDGEIVVDPDFRAMKDGVQIFVGRDGDVVKWEVVDDLSKSPADARHCEVDYSTGAIKFGDGEHGKIPEKGNNIYATYSVERDGFIEISKAIKETTEKINEKEGTSHVANVYTSYETDGFITKMSAKNADEWYDGMTIHPYSDHVGGGTNVDAFYDNAMKRAEDSGIGKVERKMTLLRPKGKVPVISEFGIFRNEELQLRSQTHAIYIAKVLMEYVRLGSPYIQKHCLSDWYSSGADSLGPTQQAVIQVVAQEGADKTTGEGNFTFFSTPSAHVFQMLNAGFGDDIVETVLSEVPQMENGAKTLSSLASMDESGNIYIALVNADREHDRNIALQINGADVAGRVMTIQKLETETLADANTPEEPDKVHVTESEAVVLEGNPVINLKKHSFVIAKIAAQVDKAALQKEIEETEKLNADYYTDFGPVEEALEAAKAVLNDSAATQAQVDKAVADLQAAREALVMKDADYSAVDAAISAVNKLNKADYKDFSAVEAAVNAVVRGKKIDEQALVDAMAKRINDAVNALQKIETKPDPKPDQKPDPKPDQGQTQNPTPNPAPTPNNQGSQAPVTTGDEASPVLWMLLIVMAGAVIVMTRKKVLR